MSHLQWLLIGACGAGPAWIALTVWFGKGFLRRMGHDGSGRRYREQLEELSRLAGGLAHEIKNPLSTINVNLKLLMEDVPGLRDSQHGGWLRRLEGVQKEADRLKGILDDFQHYAGRYELDFNSVDLRRLVQELVDFFAPQAEASHMTMRTTLPDEPVVARLDADLFKQALLNLIINASQAMTDGGELMIRLSTSRWRAILEVIDTGRGIPAENLPRIFEAYFSTKKQGTGLGLATTRRIILEHGGTVRVESEVGKGTRFVITLPLTQG